jgi:hypothetical protein
LLLYDDPAASELASDYEAIASVARASMMDFAVVIRHRTLDLVAADEPLLESDLAFIESISRMHASTTRAALASTRRFNVPKRSPIVNPPKSG